MSTVLPYRHIFFDLDHTLWDFDANAIESLAELYNHFKLESRAIGPFEAFYQHYLTHNALLWNRFEKGYITQEELKWRRMWRTLLDFKIADEALAKQMSEYFLVILPTKKRVFDYTFEILQYLTEKNYGLHLITNGFEKTQRSKLDHAGLTSYFQNIITSEISNSVKPKKEIFDFAIKQANGKMAECIMIGDNQEADIAGAQSAGMDAIFVNHINAVCSQNPKYTICHLKELENIF